MGKLIAASEWDADVPENISHLDNLTHKFKLKKKRSSEVLGIASTTTKPEETHNGNAESVKPKRKKKRKSKATAVSSSKIEHPQKENTAETVKPKRPKKRKPDAADATSSIDKDEKPPNETTKSVRPKRNRNKKKNESHAVPQDTSQDATKVSKRANKKRKLSSSATSDDKLNSDPVTDVSSNKKQKPNRNGPTVEMNDSTKIKTDKGLNKNALKKQKKKSLAAAKQPISINNTSVNKIIKFDDDADVQNSSNIISPVKKAGLTQAEKNRRRRRKKKVVNPDSSNVRVALSPIADDNKKIPSLIVNNKTKISKNSPEKLNKKSDKLRDKMRTLLSSDLVNLKPPEVLPGQPPKKQKPKSFRAEMLERLSSARFRYLNEQMYMKQSNDAQKIFKEDPSAFQAYHDGYKQQVNKWPLNPLDVIIKDISSLPKEYIIADMGCGDGRLSKSVTQKVHSFDLVSLNSSVQACDMSHTPLLTAHVNVVVFCLSLMGTNLKDYIIEANRVLKVGGLLKVAEVESRFEDVEAFLKDVQKYGFSLIKSDLNQNLFYFMDFKKENDIKKRNKVPNLNLKPCIYKKR